MISYDILFIIFDDDENFIELLRMKLIRFSRKIGISYCIIKNPKTMELDDLNFNHMCFFLDIEMPEKNGLILGRELREDYPSAEIIFISNHESYVFDSFNARPYGYFKKNQFDTKLNDYFNYMQYNYFDIFIYNFGNNAYSIYKNQIIYIKKYINSIEIFTKTSSFSLRMTISEALNILNSKNNDFFKIHRSIIVNLQNVVKFENNELLLYNGEKVLIARNRLSAFRQSYTLFIAKKKK